MGKYVEDTFIKIWEGRSTFIFRILMQIVAWVILCVYAWYDIIEAIIHDHEIVFSKTDGIIIFICTGVLIAFELVQLAYRKLLNSKINIDNDIQ